MIMKMKEAHDLFLSFMIKLNYKFIRLHCRNLVMAIIPCNIMHTYTALVLLDVIKLNFKNNEIKSTLGCKMRNKCGLNLYIIS